MASEGERGKKDHVIYDTQLYGVYLDPMTGV